MACREGQFRSQVLEGAGVQWGAGRRTPRTLQAGLSLGKKQNKKAASAPRRAGQLILGYFSSWTWNDFSGISPKYQAIFPMTTDGAIYGEAVVRSNS